MKNEGEKKRTLIHRSVQALKRKPHGVLMDVLLGERYVGKIRVKANDGIFAVQDAIDAAKQTLPGVRGSESLLRFYPIVEKPMTAAISF